MGFAQQENKRRVLAVFGTRPDAVKMCPLVSELRRRAAFEVGVCVTGQHRQMLEQALALFSVEPDFDLRVMQQGQPLDGVTARILEGMGPVLDTFRPALVFVHGDTTTAFAAALACLYRHIPVAHVEAGLRTYDLTAPFPEEFNRRAVGLIARYHFAPTQAAADNLLAEGTNPKTVFVTGNTVIDALAVTRRAGRGSPLAAWARDSRLLLVTAHRRENLGAPMAGMFRAVRRIVEQYPDVKAICPMHPNPAVRRTAQAELGGCERIRLTEPLALPDFHGLMEQACCILTDSGGVQEEATAMGRPVLVMRERTERPEGVAAGAIWLVGTGEEQIVRACRTLLDDAQLYETMCRPRDLYGDGGASRRIADITERLCF